MSRISFFLNNFEVVKINMYHVDLYNLFLCAFFVMLALLWRRKQKNHKNESQILCVAQTNQLRGLAIICVVIGHFWVHVVSQTPHILFGGDAVALFLLLSGFGLTVTSKGQVENILRFIRKRGRKVLIPYWISTVFILTLDYFLLERTYSWQNYLVTFAGVNINPIVRNIDYVRWYITFQLFWYVIFALIFRYTKGLVAIFLFLIVPSFLFVFDYYVTRLGWYQVFAFPSGVLLGYFYDSVERFFNRFVRLFTWGSVILFCCVLVFKTYNQQLVEPYIPSIVFKALKESVSLVLCLTVICFCAIWGKKGKVSVFLSFCGGISYELFLLHGPFLVKYNPVIRAGAPETVVMYFLLYMALMMLLALTFKQVVRGVHNVLFV